MEQTFRWLFVAILGATFAQSAFYRHRARKVGGTIARRREGTPTLAARALIALPLFGSFLLYAIEPQWMAWSAFSLPAWARWLGVGIGVACVPLLAWVFRSIGSNISETVLTKERHQLVTAGPYRWVRHPLYSVGSTVFAALSVIAASWFMGLFVLLALLAVIFAVIPREEAHLERAFGAEYSSYRRRTGRLVPRLRPAVE